MYSDFLDGSICIVFDACINSRPYNQSLEDEDFKKKVTPIVTPAPVVPPQVVPPVIIGTNPDNYKVFAD